MDNKGYYLYLKPEMFDMGFTNNLLRLNTFEPIPQKLIPTIEHEREPKNYNHVPLPHYPRIIEKTQKETELFKIINIKPNKLLSRNNSNQQNKRKNNVNPKLNYDEIIKLQDTLNIENDHSTNVLPFIRKKINDNLNSNRTSTYTRNKNIPDSSNGDPNQRTNKIFDYIRNVAGFTTPSSNTVSTNPRTLLKETMGYHNIEEDDNNNNTDDSIIPQVPPETKKTYYTVPGPLPQTNVFNPNDLSSDALVNISNNQAPVNPTQTNGFKPNDLASNALMDLSDSLPLDTNSQAPLILSNISPVVKSNQDPPTPINMQSPEYMDDNDDDDEIMPFDEKLNVININNVKLKSSTNSFSDSKYESSIRTILGSKPGSAKVASTKLSNDISYFMTIVNRVSKHKYDLKEYPSLVRFVKFAKGLVIGKNMEISIKALSKLLHLRVPAESIDSLENLRKLYGLSSLLALQAIERVGTLLAINYFKDFMDYINLGTSENNITLSHFDEENIDIKKDLEFVNAVYSGAMKNPNDYYLAVSDDFSFDPKDHTDIKSRQIFIDTFNYYK